METRERQKWLFFAALNDLVDTASFAKPRHDLAVRAVPVRGSGIGVSRPG
jgi:hypothetical protein